MLLAELVAVEAMDIVDRNDRDFGDLSLRSHELIHFQLLKERFRPGVLLVLRTGLNPGDPRLQRLWSFDLRALVLDDVQCWKMLR